MEVQEQPAKKDIKLDFKDSKYATGRRKKSIARVWLKKGPGNFLINGQKMNDYFKKMNLQIAILRPLSSVNVEILIRLSSRDVSFKSAIVVALFASEPPPPNG